jgi:hypothetical protein
MKLIIDYFSGMTGAPTLGRRIYTRYGVLKLDTYHKYMHGFVPHYAQLASPASDTAFNQKVTPPLPLVLAPNLTGVTSAYGKYPVLLLANEHNALGKVIYVTDTWEFNSSDPTDTTIGIPSGTPDSNVNIDATIFNGQILTSHPTSGSLYYGAISATPGWTATSGSVSTGTAHIVRNFQDKCLVTDASSGAFSRNDKVTIVNSDFSFTDGITLGDTFHILDIGNFQDRYALLFTQKTTSPLLSTSTIVFMWDAVPGDQYDQKFRLQGTYACSVVKDDILHVFTQVGPNVLCYAFTGAGFKKIALMQNVTISKQTGIPKSRVSVDGDFFVLLATSGGNTNGTQPFYWNPYTGEGFFLVNTPDSASPFIAVCIANDPNSNTVQRYLSYQNTGSVGFVYKVTMENSTRTDGGASYKSNSIGAPVVKGVNDMMPMGRMQINYVEVEYSAPPPSSSDSIALSLVTKDAYESDSFSTVTATAKDTDANSTNANIHPTRAIMQVGASATEFEIDLAVTVSTTSWAVIIRRIVVDYDPIALQQ